MKCARHPKVETALSCGRCGTPICPDCAILGPVGMLCKNCAAIRGSSLYKVRPERFALAAIAGIAAGTIAGFVLQAIGFFIFFIAPVIGGFLGEVILRSTGRKRGTQIEVLAGVSVVGGALLSVLLLGTWRMYSHPLSLIIFIVAVGMTAASAVGKIRYF